MQVKIANGQNVKKQQRAVFLGAVCYTSPIQPQPRRLLLKCSQNTTHLWHCNTATMPPKMCRKQACHPSSSISGRQFFQLQHNNKIEMMLPKLCGE